MNSNTTENKLNSMMILVKGYDEKLMDADRLIQRLEVRNSVVVDSCLER
jgi:hypothetical protein